MSEAIFHALGERLRAARRPSEIAFIACNGLRELLPYRQAALLRVDARGRARLVAHSGLADVDPRSPYAQWLAQLAGHVWRAELDGTGTPPAGLPALLELTPDALPDALAESWAEWLPARACVLRIAATGQPARALLVLGRDAPADGGGSGDGSGRSGSGSGSGGLNGGGGAGDVERVARLAPVIAHAWQAVEPRGVVAEAARGVRRHRWAVTAAAVALAVLALVVPVRDYALVPAEVVSTAARVVTAPRDGVVRRIAVAPNATVRAGDVLVEFDPTSLDNRLAVAQAALQTARVDQQQAMQRAIESPAARTDVQLAVARLREREVDVLSLERERAQLTVLAPADGVFVYTDPDDWAGRPVQTGERLGQLADPHQLGLQAWAPLADAVNLDRGAPITLFLRAAPLDPVAATLTQASYQAVEGPDGISSHLVRATIDDAAAHEELRIGLRGTARVSGERIALGMLLFRRPIASLREWCGC